MIYKQEITDKINLVNSVLSDLGVSSLLTNTDFSIDEDFHHEQYVKFNFEKSESVALSLVLMGDALQINVDKTDEAFEWSEKQIREDKNGVTDFIKLLLTSTIKVEYCGSNYTKLYFIDGSGRCVKTFRYVTGFYLKIGCKTKEYAPIYP